MKLTLATIAWNEEALIGRMLESVRGMVDEIVIGIDRRTTDATESIAMEHGARTFRFDWTDDFAAARNLTLERATGGWVLMLDCDETLTTDGVSVIRDVLGKPSRQKLAYDGYCFFLANTDLDGQLLNVVATSSRLFVNRPDLRYRGYVHEEVFFPGPRMASLCLIKGVVAISHVGYDQSIWVSRHKHQRNVRLLNKRLLADPDDTYARDKLAEELKLDEFGMLRE